jgi:(2Fe-2S) ferredoxin
MRRFRIVICRGPECGEHRHSAALQPAFATALDTSAMRDQVELAWQSCFGRCTQGPNVLVREIVEPPAPVASPALLGPRGVTALYNRVDSAGASRIVSEHVVRGEIVHDLIERPGIHPRDPVASRTKDS